MLTMSNEQSVTEISTFSKKKNADGTCKSCHHDATMLLVVDNVLLVRFVLSS